MSNIKELIRAEIERRKVDALDKGFTFVPAALQDLLSFLDTLPDEPVSDCHDLEEAAEEYIQKIKAVFLRTLEHPTAKDCFIHGAKWAFRQGWTFDAHKGAFGICFDRNIDDLLDSLKDEEEVTVQIRKK